MDNKAPRNTSAYLQTLLAPLKPHLVGIGLFSFCINILMLAPAIYMLQVFDRAVSSGSESTLLMLTLILIFLMSSMGLLEWVRRGLFQQAAGKLDELLAEPAFNASFRRALLRGGRRGVSSMPLQDVVTLRAYLDSSSASAFFDAPWIPVYLLVMYLFHWSFGVLGVFAAAGLLGLSWINHRTSLKASTRAKVETRLGQDFCEQNLRNAEVVAAMGMMPNVQQHWQRHHLAGAGWQAAAGQVNGRYVSLTRTLRLLLQSLALGLGAYLAINGEITPGMMIAGSILMGRALAPVDQLIASWRQFQQARGSYSRLNEVLGSEPETPERLSLPAPSGEVALESVNVFPPGARTPALKGISFRVAAGTFVGIVGPSAAGKSSLARTLLGVWPPNRGSVRLDGAELQQWNPGDLGKYVGYLPQDIELFEGSVAQNIARFGTVDSEEVVAAAQRAGVHNLILRLPEGYDTLIGADGGVLSAGQRQRIGLARALYGKPKLIVLDEPDAHLDEAGEMALRQALNGMREWQATVFVITHKPRLLVGLDRVMVLSDGSIVDSGDARQILEKYKQPAVQATPARSGPAEGDAS
ncbi:MAG: type I secretion system permease/ATPase [Halieaceae bacterium]|jgi:ATP-binding cassette subfamily C protein EexD|nr:type I secretion system permease/ATPase [Halieaceae bacterium]